MEELRVFVSRFAVHGMAFVERYRVPLDPTFFSFRCQCLVRRADPSNSNSRAEGSRWQSMRLAWSSDFTQRAFIESYPMNQMSAQNRVIDSDLSFIFVFRTSRRTSRL